MQSFDRKCFIEVSQPPFQVTESGWGEFESSIKIYFHDPEEEPITLFHQIKLYPPGPPQPLTTKRPIVSERYDEVIFTDPTEVFYRLLTQYSPTKSSEPIASTNVNPLQVRFQRNNCLQLILNFLGILHNI